MSNVILITILPRPLISFRSPPPPPPPPPDNLEWIIKYPINYIQ